MKLILLPGMDGTGDLFDPIVSHLSGHCTIEIISYLRDKYLDYEALVSYVKERLQRSEDYLPLAESFSGTIAYQRLQAVIQLQRPIRDIELPCIYLQADHDHLVTKDSFESLAKHASHIVCYKVRGGHLLLQSNPRECARIINEYLLKEIQ